MNRYDETKKLIEKAGDKVEFADFGDGVSGKWIIKAEERLGIKFPNSYKWWLENYGGGEIFGEEIYSIYEQNFDEVVGGDIVYMNELSRANSNYQRNMLIICETDDQVFYFDTSIKSKNDEYPIYELNSNKLYANDFLEFLKKRIMTD